MRNSESVYAWPPHVPGINIDARGVFVPKENPKITYDYEEGFTAPTKNHKHNTSVTVRSFATGGAAPPGKAVKRLRENEQTEMNAGQASNRDVH